MQTEEDGLSLSLSLNWIYHHFHLYVWMHIRSALTKQKMNENKLKMTRSICQTIRFECTFSIFGWHFCLAAETLVKILSTKYLFFFIPVLGIGCCVHRKCHRLWFVYAIDSPYWFVSNIEALNDAAIWKMLWVNRMLKMKWRIVINLGTLHWLQSIYLNSWFGFVVLKMNWQKCGPRLHKWWCRHLSVFLVRFSRSYRRTRKTIKMWHFRKSKVKKSNQNNLLHRRW